MEISNEELIEQYLGHEETEAWRWYASGGSTNEEGTHHYNFCAKTRSELYAEAILKKENLKKLKDINPNGRERPYIQKSHDGKTLNDEKNPIGKKNILPLLYSECRKTIIKPLPISEKSSIIRRR